MAEGPTRGSAELRTASPSVSPERNGTGAGAVEVTTVAMTPEAALARHVEWLDFALGAATAEERWRRERLAKASKGNRAKRTNRLAEVTSEVEELTALLQGIRELQARAVSAPAAPARRRGRPLGSRNKAKVAATPGETPSVNGASSAAAEAVVSPTPRQRGRRSTSPSSAG